MCTAITKEKTLDFTGLTKECWSCEDGKQYKYIEDCKDCRGKGKTLRGTRRYKCKTCEGKGYTSLAQRIENGACHICDGVRKIPLTAYESITQEDREWIFANLFNFDKPYTYQTSAFNESYLGMGIVCGITDYGRYKELSEEDFKEEVRKNFMDGWLQYVTIAAKGNLPSEILIKRGNSGWHAYPVYSPKVNS